MSTPLEAGEIGPPGLSRGAGWCSIVSATVHPLSSDPHLYVNCGRSTSRIPVGLFVLEKLIRGRLVG